MKLLIANTLAFLLLGACAAEKAQPEPAATTDTAPAVAPTTSAAAEPAPNENQVHGTWSGQIKVGQPVSMFNYVGAESGDFAPMRFRNDSPAGQKILAVCGDDDHCEFIGTVVWLDETPPENASAIGEILTVEGVKRLPDTPRP